MGQLLAVPHVSKLVAALPRQLHDESFGYAWRERVFDLRGLIVCTDLVGSEVYICDVVNLVDVPRDDLYVADKTHVCLLLPGEYIERLDVCWRDGFAIKGLRIHTNKRVSEWLGVCDEGKRTSLHAPAGHFIQVLCGYNSMTACPGYCTTIQLGAVYASLDARARLTTPTDEATAYARSAVVRAPRSSSYGTVVDTCCATPRAIVIHVDDERVGNLTVLTSDQYATVVAVDDLYVIPSEHWFVLADDERLAAVGFVFDYGNVAAIRLRTNFRVSVWYGKEVPGAEATWLDCTDQPAGSFICGLQVDKYVEDMCTYIFGLGVIYNPVDETQAEVAAKDISQTVGGAG